MATIPGMTVPEVAIPALTWLGKLPDNEYNAILAALPGSESEVTSQKDLATRFASALESADRTRARELAAIVLSLVALGSSHGWDVVSMAETVASDPVLELDDHQRSALRRWLDEALANIRISRLALVQDVRDEYQSVFHSAQVFSDLRPIFDSPEPDGPPSGMLISHTLKILYGTVDGTNEIYIALDDDDLDALEEVVVRAKKRGRELRKFLKSVDVPELGSGSE